MRTGKLVPGVRIPLSPQDFEKSLKAPDDGAFVLEPVPRSLVYFTLFSEGRTTTGSNTFQSKGFPSILSKIFLKGMAVVVDDPAAQFALTDFLHISELLERGGLYVDFHDLRTTYSMSA